MLVELKLWVREEVHPKLYHLTKDVLVEVGPFKVGVQCARRHRAGCSAFCSSPACSTRRGVAYSCRHASL